MRRDPRSAGAASSRVHRPRRARHRGTAKAGHRKAHATAVERDDRRMAPAAGLRVRSGRPPAYRVNATHRCGDGRRPGTTPRPGRPSAYDHRAPGRTAPHVAARLAARHRAGGSPGQRAAIGARPHPHPSCAPARRPRHRLIPRSAEHPGRRRSRAREVNLPVRPGGWPPGRSAPGGRSTRPVSGTAGGRPGQRTSALVSGRPARARRAPRTGAGPWAPRPSRRAAGGSPGWRRSTGWWPGSR